MKLKCVLIIGGVLIALFVGYVLNHKPQPPSEKYVKDLGYPVHIILKPSLDSRASPSVVWEPTSQQTSDIVSSLESYIKTRSLPKEQQLRPLNHYALQFGGIEKNGKQYIHINAFCMMYSSIESLEKNWNSTADGGSCFFRVRYDPENKKFSCLSINADQVMAYEDPNCESEADTNTKAD